MSYCLRHNRDSKIIYYHDLGRNYSDMGTEFDLFQRHLNIIEAMGFKLVDTISDEKNQIMVCFDDGLRGIYYHQDYFIKKDFFPTIFLAVELIGERNYLTKEEIIEMEKKGFHFQCHSWSHTGLPFHTEIELKHELEDSKKYLENVLGYEVDSICFPQGLFSQTVIDKCKEYGYKKMYSSISGSYNHLKEKGLLCRHLLQDIPDPWVKYIIEGDSVLLRKHLAKLHYIK